MLLLPVACLLLGALLPPTLAQAPSFTNGHMFPRHHQLGEGADEPPLRARPARMGTPAEQHQEEVAAVVQETTPWAKQGEDQFEPEQVPEVVADVAEEPNTEEPKTYEQLLAEELQKREEELGRRIAEQKLRTEEQQRRDEEQKLREEELKRRADTELLVQQEELQRRAHAELLVQEELERRAAAEVLVQKELETRKKVADLIAAAAGPVPEVDPVDEPAPEHEEEFFRPQSAGRGGFRPSRFDVQEDTRNKRHEEIVRHNHDQNTTDDIELRQQEEDHRHMDNLSRKEEIEIEHLEHGLAHEAAGVDQHQHEAYEHDRINEERDMMIKQQEMERHRMEKEREKEEEMRKMQEMEKMQREQEEIIQEQNLKRQMDSNVHTHHRPDAQGGEDHSGGSVASPAGALLVLTVLANLRPYILC